MSDQGKPIMVTVNVVCESQQEAAKVAEVVSRTMLGLALDGLYASMSISHLEGCDHDG